jgi:SpoVK/Ycf46/Vps4 family AAA+-type ATPase
MITSTAPSTVWQSVPSAPSSLESSGLSLDLVTQLAIKTLHYAGELTGSGLASRLGLSWPVIEPVLEALKGQRQVEVVGGSYLGGATYRYRITDSGRARAVLFLESSAYVGPAPVPLAQYRAYIDAFTSAAPHSATPDRLRRAFPHLVLPERVLDQIGPAINAGQSLFIYGEAGNGKTQIARGIRDVLDGGIAVPHAIEVEGQVIRLFDPVTHEPVGASSTTAAAAPGSSYLDGPQAVSDSLDLGAMPDGRWVPCKRPVVTVGGELSLDSLMLGRGPGGYYKASLQLLANGGVLVIDDFGRQRCSTTELLNRWIVPLESRVDYLTLSSGQTFEVPFRVLVVFATNLRPQELVDEAFLRRIHAKVRIPGPTRAEYGRIFRDYCATAGVDFDQAHVDHVLDGFYRIHGIPMRGCHPRDLVSHALLLAEYRGEPRALSATLLESACEVYFVRGDEVEAGAVE